MSVLGALIKYAIADFDYLNFRYQIFQNVCAQYQIGVLLIAHHADDQVCYAVL